MAVNLPAQLPNIYAHVTAKGTLNSEERRTANKMAKKAVYVLDFLPTTMTSIHWTITRSAWNELGKHIMKTFKALIVSAYLIRIVITPNLSYCFQELAAIN
jgi:hypothetical protein